MMKRRSPAWRNLFCLSACALVLALTDAALQSGARAQSCKPFAADIIFRDGSKLTMHTCGGWEWAGITDDKVGGSPNNPLFARTLVRFVCRETQCRDTPSPPSPATVDTVVWDDGSRTTGRLEVRCHSRNNFCDVFQDGALIAPKNPNYKDRSQSTWDYVKYVELAARKQ